MTYEEKLAEFEELMRKPIGPAKPKVVNMQFTQKFARQMRERPEDVMVWIRGKDGVPATMEMPSKMVFEDAVPRTIYEKIDARK
jgi:hypothetical protein